MTNTIPPVTYVPGSPKARELLSPSLLAADVTGTLNKVPFPPRVSAVMAHTYHRYKPGSEPVAGYHLRVCLGSGGFGEVWKGVGPGGTEVAIKIIDLTGQQGFQEFKSLRLVKKAAHPNLVPLHAYWLKDEDSRVISDEAVEAGATEATSDFVKPVELVIVMGLGRKCLNKRLAEVRADGEVGIPVDELLDYVDGAARGLDYLNSQIGIVHGDVKPHNILIVGDAAAVCDFGLARAVESLRKTSMAPMTVAYAAPESFRGRPTVKSDQYSLAITYIELRTGRLPFEETLSPFDLMNTHVTGHLDLSRLPPYEREVVRRATAVNPDDRWNTNRDFARALAQAHAADPQGKLLPGAPFEEDLDAPGFIATLKRDSHPSGGHRAEQNRQTLESTQQGVTPREPFAPGMHSLSGSNPGQPHTTPRSTYMPPGVPPPHDTNPPQGAPAASPYDYQPVDTATPRPSLPISKGMLAAGAGVLALLLVLGVWLSRPGSSTKDKDTTTASNTPQVMALVDRLIAERRFPIAIAELQQLAASQPNDEPTQKLVVEKREELRKAWIDVAEHAARDQRAAEAKRLANELLRYFPNDPAAGRVLAGNVEVPATAPVKTESVVERTLREAENLLRAGKWAETLDRLESPPVNIGAEDRQRLATQAASVRKQWLATAQAYYDAGVFPDAQRELQGLLGRYSTFVEARVLRLRTQLAQNNYSAARGELQTLQAATNLSPEAQDLRSALGIYIALKVTKVEPAQIYADLLKLKNLDTTASGDPWQLTPDERTLLRSTRATLLAADYDSLVKAPRTKEQLPLVDKLLAHWPDKRYDLLLVKSELLTATAQLDAARQQLDEATALLGKSPSTEQQADLAARRLVISLRDPQTLPDARLPLIAEAERLQSRWQPARRGDLAYALIELSKQDRTRVEPLALRIINVGLKLEPGRRDLYQCIEAIRGDEWTPRLQARMNDSARPTAEQWKTLYADCNALKALRKADILYDAARAEAMAELGMDLDKGAIDIADRAGGWPDDGYVQYVAAKVDVVAGHASEAIGNHITRALAVARTPPQLGAPFRREWMREALVMAARRKRMTFRDASLVTVFAKPYKNAQDASAALKWLQQAASMTSNAPSVGERVNVALATAFQSRGDAAGARTAVRDMLALADSQLGDDLLAVVGLDYVAEPAGSPTALKSAARMVRYYRTLKHPEPQATTRFYLELIVPALEVAKSGAAAAEMNVEAAQFFDRFRDMSWPFGAIDPQIDKLCGAAIAADSQFADAYRLRGGVRLKRQPPDLVGAAADAKLAVQLAPQSPLAGALQAEVLALQIPTLQGAARDAALDTYLDGLSKAVASDVASPKQRAELCVALAQRSPTMPRTVDRIAAWERIVQVAERLQQDQPAVPLTPEVELPLGNAHESLATFVKHKPAEHFRAAVDAYSRAIETKPTAEALTARARTYLRFTLQREDRLDPEVTFGKSRFGVHDLAEADLKQACQLAANDPEPERWWGRLLREQADAQGGDEHLVKAIALARKHAPAKLATMLEEWSQSAISEEQFDEARRRTDQFLTADTPNDLVPRLKRVQAVIRGRAAFEEAKYAEAIQQFDLAVPPAELKSATLDELPTLLQRARCRVLGKAPSDVTQARQAIEAGLNDLARAGELAADDTTRGKSAALAATLAYQRTQLPGASDDQQRLDRQQALTLAGQALTIAADSPESVGVRVKQLKLWLAQLADSATTDAEREQLTAQLKAAFAIARQQADQQQLASELGELLRLEFEHAAIFSPKT